MKLKKRLKSKNNIMQTNNHKINDYDAVLDAKFGKEGTPSSSVELIPIQ